MNVKIKNFDIDMDVKTKGIEFEVRTPDGKTQLGDCYITMTGLIWCPGRTGKNNGVKVEWHDFIALMSDRATLKRGVNAVKKPSAN